MGKKLDHEALVGLLARSTPTYPVLVSPGTRAILNFSAFALTPTVLNTGTSLLQGVSAFSESSKANRAWKHCFLEVKVGYSKLGYLPYLPIAFAFAFLQPRNARIESPSQDRSLTALQERGHHHSDGAMPRLHPHYKRESFATLFTMV